MNRVASVSILIVSFICFTACNPKMSTVDKRKKQLEKKKRKHPDDCPKIDC